MIRAIIRLFCFAFIISYLIPVLPGSAFKGDLFPEAVALAMLLGVTMFLFNYLFSVSVEGTVSVNEQQGTRVVIPFYVIAYWLVPTIMLKILALCFPATLGLKGWLGACLAGLSICVLQRMTRARVSAPTSTGQS